MLTDEAIRDREWHGMPYLRALLEENYRDFRNSFYLTSVSDTDFDHLHRTATLAAYVTDGRSIPALIDSVQPPFHSDLRRQRAEAAAEDLERLAGMLHHHLSWLSSLARGVTELRKEVLRTSEQPAEGDDAESTTSDSA